MDINDPIKLDQELKDVLNIEQQEAPFDAKDSTLFFDRETVQILDTAPSGGFGMIKTSCTILCRYEIERILDLMRPEAYLEFTTVLQEQEQSKPVKKQPAKEKHLQKPATKSTRARGPIEQVEKGTGKVIAVFKSSYDIANKFALRYHILRMILEPGFHGGKPNLKEQLIFDQYDFVRQNKTVKAPVKKVVAKKKAPVKQEPVAKRSWFKRLIGK